MRDGGGGGLLNNEQCSSTLNLKLRAGAGWGGGERGRALCLHLHSCLLPAPGEQVMQWETLHSQWQYFKIKYNDLLWPCVRQSRDLTFFLVLKQLALAALQPKTVLICERIFTEQAGLRMWSFDLPTYLARPCWPGCWWWWWPAGWQLTWSRTALTSSWCSSRTSFRSVPFSWW